MEKDHAILKKADEFFQMIKKSEEFTKELLRENERLRFKVAQLEDTIERFGDEAKIKVYDDRIKALESELISIKERYRQVEEENKDFASKYIEVEEQNNALANLYVASYQLHSTLDYDEVLKIVLEIVINLVGAEAFVVYLIDEKTGQIIPVASEGAPLENIPRVNAGEGIVGMVIKEGESYFAASVDKNAGIDYSTPIACIPMKIKEHVIGAVGIYSLLSHKEAFTNIDYELFNLLAGHTATAIFSAKLYTQSERKLSTIQSFLDLLKDKPKIRG